MESNLNPQEESQYKRRISRPWWKRNLIVLAVSLFILVWVRELCKFAPESAWLSASTIFLVWLLIPDLPRFTKKSLLFLKIEFIENRFWRRFKKHLIALLIVVALASYVLSFIVLKSIGVRRAGDQGCCNSIFNSSRCSYTFVDVGSPIGKTKDEILTRIHQSTKAHMMLVDFYSPILYLEDLFVKKHKPIHFDIDKNGTQPYSFASPLIVPLP